MCASGVRLRADEQVNCQAGAPGSSVAPLVPEGPPQHTDSDGPFACCSGRPLRPARWQSTAAKALLGATCAGLTGERSPVRRQGEAATSLFIIISGRVRLVREVPTKRPAVRVEEEVRAAPHGRAPEPAPGLVERPARPAWHARALLW